MQPSALCACWSCARFLLTSESAVAVVTFPSSSACCVFFGSSWWYARPPLTVLDDAPVIFIKFDSLIPLRPDRRRASTIRLEFICLRHIVGGNHVPRQPFAVFCGDPQIGQVLENRLDTGLDARFVAVPSIDYHAFACDLILHEQDWELLPVSVLSHALNESRDGALVNRDEAFSPGVFSVS